MTTPDAPPAPPRSRVPQVVAVSGLAFEFAGLVVLAALGVAAEATNHVGNSSAGLAVTAFVALMAAAVGGTCLAVARGRRWAVAPALTVQLFALFAFVWPLITNGSVLLGCGLGLVAAATGAGLLAHARTLPPRHG
ncbi:MAG: hypothetical protein ACK5MT_21210 [Actinomycetales bacterium]